MQKRCRTCGSSQFRISHFRITDFTRLFVLQYPVRCKVCQERSFAFFMVAVEIRRKRTKSAKTISNG